MLRLLHPPLEELGDQDAAAEPCRPHRLAENTGKTAPIGGRMHLQLALRSHQMQRRGCGKRRKRTQTGPLQRMAIPGQGSRGSMAGGQACGHRVGCHQGYTLQTSNVAARCDSTRPLTLRMVCCEIRFMVDPSETRADGRRPNALRPFEVSWDPMGFALSSLIVRTGRTAVLCSVCLEETVPRWRKGNGLGWISAEYRLLPGSTPQRQSRELLKLSGRTQEIQRLIGRSLRAAVDLEALGERSLLIDCDVIQADAGTRTASVTGAWMALQLACDRLIAQGILERQPIRSQVAAVSVGLLEGRPLLDLDYSEDSRADVDLNVVASGDGSLLEIQGTAEGAPFSRGQLNVLLDLAQPGLDALLAAQSHALSSRS